MTPSPPLSIFTDGLREDLKKALASTAGVVAAPQEQAQVWVIPLQRDPFPLPPRAAVLVVGDGLEDSRWSLVPADHAVSAGDLQADPLGSVQTAWARRLALRPGAGDTCAEWLEGIRQVLSVDVAVWHDRTGTVVSGEAGEGDWAAAAAAAPWIGTEEVAWLGPRSGMQAGAAIPIAAKDRGVLMVTIRDGGPAFARRCAAPLREIAMAASNAALAADLARCSGRIQWLEAMLHGLVSGGSHDLRNAVFGLQIGAKLLGRFPEAAPTVANLRGSVGGPIENVQQMLTGVRELLNGPAAPTQSTSRLPEVWARAVETATRHKPELLPQEPPPDVEVAVSPSTLELLLTVLLRNAVPHPPVEIQWAVDDARVRFTARNPGTLPFRDLSRIAPFEHRSPGRAGLGLCLARASAAAAGVGLQVKQEEDKVLAELILPRPGQSAR